MRRTLLLTILAIAVLAGPAAAAPTPDSKIFTLAGAGTAVPHDGAQAGAARLSVFDVEALADGSLLVLDALPKGGSQLERIAPDGTLHQITAVGQRVVALTVAADGSVVYLSRNDLVVRRLDLATGAVTTVANLASVPQPKQAQAYDVAALDDGSFVASAGETPANGGTSIDGGDLTVFRVSAAGVVTRAYPDTKDAPQRASALAALPGGAFALPDLDRQTVVRVAPDGTRTDLGKTGSAIGGLVGLPDGSVIAGTIYDQLTLLPAGGPAVPLVVQGGGTSPGIGDGGPLSGADVDAGALAVTPDGDLLIGGYSGLRVVPSPTTSLSFASLTPASFLTLRQGKATLLTSAPGTAVLTLKGTAGTVTSPPQQLPAGGGPVTFASAPKPGRYTLTVTFTGASGRSTVSSTRLDTRTTLPRAEALKVINQKLADEGDGDEESYEGPVIGACRRPGALRVECVVYDALTSGHGKHARTRRTCDGRITATLQPDGVIVLARRQASCRL